MSSLTSTKLSYLRTRSGCMTCRRRRIKCDEQRPICARCARGDRKCEYAQQQLDISLATHVSVSRELLPQHLLVSKEYLDFRFFLDYSAPLLCTATSTGPMTSNETSSLFIDNSGKLLLGYHTRAYNEFWKEFVPGAIYSEPVIYKLACLYGSMHRSAVSGTLIDNRTEAVMYGQILHMLSSSATSASADIVVAGALMLFSIERLQAASWASYKKGLLHMIAAVQMIKKRHDGMLISDLSPRIENHFQSFVSFFQTHYPIDPAISSMNPTSVYNIHIPSVFADCQEAINTFTQILEMEPQCDCLPHTYWSPNCSAFVQRIVLLRQWRTVVHAWYRRLCGKNFSETVQVFRLLIALSMVEAAVGIASMPKSSQHSSFSLPNFEELLFP